MFELIKKWLKRPIVINFTVEPLSPDATFVLKHEREITPEIAEALSKAWSERYKSKVIVIGPGITLEQMTDEQLKAVGLMRVDFNTLDYPGPSTIPEEGTWLLNASERVIKANTNTDLTKCTGGR
ncbi:hypothetical protein F925_02311 [Acinetobacter lwoffii NCTC 5866 = CIP 64.10 = NIPH 512]|nr:hypothetical protein F925_02311 [Acinetobacter lwoffii NCTC 5866 = CIP 64.10 = NIPH 512]